MTSSKPYQGYPYASPVVTEAPSLNASEVAALSKWRDLPTRKITTQPISQGAQDTHKSKDEYIVYIDPKTDSSNDSLYPHYPSTKRTPKQNDPEPEPEPTIYIDLPEDNFSGSSVSEGTTITSTSGNDKSEFNSTTGINNATGVNNISEGSYELNSTNGGNNTNWEFIGASGSNEENVKKTTDGASFVNEDNDEIEPVVYIDIPESDASNVSQRLAATESEPDYAEQTIYYNPFKEDKTNCREEEEEVEEEEEATGSQPGPYQRPWPPNSLDLTSPGSSTSTPNLPTFLSKEAYVYGRQPTPDDGFSLSPIPLNEYHPPPPSYEESARTQSTQQGSEFRPAPQPPRTQVIVHNPGTHVVGQPDLQRQLLYCHHCSKQVNTLVVRESGMLTHAVAWAFMLACIFPITIGIYCVDTFKYRNHYCPNCNKKIGYEIPFLLCHKMQYVYE